MGNGKGKQGLDLQGIYTGRGGKHGKRILDTATEAAEIKDKRERITFMLEKLSEDLSNAKNMDEVRELQATFKQNTQAWISLALA